MRYIKILAIALLAISAVSCTSYKEIRIEKVTGINVREFSGSTALVDLTVLVDNPTGSMVKLNKLDLDVIRFDSKFAHIESLGKVEVPARSHLEKTILLEIRITNILSSGFLLFSKKLNPDDFTANGFIKVSSFPFCKKIKVENQKVGSVIKGLDSILSPSRKQ